MAPANFTAMPSGVYVVLKLKWSAGVKNDVVDVVVVVVVVDDDDDDDDDNNNNNNNNNNKVG